MSESIVQAVAAIGGATAFVLCVGLLVDLFKSAAR